MAQCGGAGNVERFLEVAGGVDAQEPFAPYLDGWEGTWNFATAQETEARLRRAGFPEARAWLEPFPVVPESPREYLRVVCLGPHLERLPDELHDRYVDAVVEACGEPLELDYIRLNIEAMV